MKIPKITLKINEWIAMKYKLIFLLLAIITGLSIINALASLPKSAEAKPGLWAHPAEQAPVLIAGNSRGGKGANPTPTP
jgi:hypothetical protein